MIPEAAPRRRISLVGVMIAVTAVVCIIAVAFRHDIRSRYWAYRAAHATTLSERTGYLNQLMLAGDYGQWGLRALCDDENADNRQFAALALQGIRSSWTRGLLYQLVQDHEPAVRDVAILGLAAHRDEAALRYLTQMYCADSTEEALAARTACAGLQRFGDERAVAALAALVERPAPVRARAGLVDALGELGGLRAAAALLLLLEDHRVCDAPRFEEALAWQALGGISSAQRAAAGAALAAASSPASAPSRTAPTIAERAADALGRITGRHPPFLSSMSEIDRRLARNEWESWNP